MTRSDFPVHWPVLTRWTDNDMFGHLNNAVYYELFDTAINAWINTSCGIDPLTVGLAVARLGNTSVTYRLAIFGEAEAAAEGHGVHVYVDRASRRPVPIPGPIRSLLESICSPDAARKQDS